MLLENWEQILDSNPSDWTTRMIYADWLDENGMPREAAAQRWMARNEKTPGPACVIEAAPGEATWFAQTQENQNWTFQGYRNGVVRPEWCLPMLLFKYLYGYITKDRRDRGMHNQYARSWGDRRLAEAALARIDFLDFVEGE